MLHYTFIRSLQSREPVSIFDYWEILRAPGGKTEYVSRYFIIEYLSCYWRLQRVPDNFTGSWYFYFQGARKETGYPGYRLLGEGTNLPEDVFQSVQSLLTDLDRNRRG